MQKNTLDFTGIRNFTNAGNFFLSSFQNVQFILSNAWLEFSVIQNACFCHCSILAHTSYVNKPVMVNP